MTANSKNQPWSDKDDQFLSLVWGQGVDGKQVAEELGRTREAVEARARRLGLCRAGSKDVAQ